MRDGHRLALVLLLVAGFVLRMYDLTDPPLEFHPTRQLHTAIIARYLYVTWNPHSTPEERETAARQFRRDVLLEPPLLQGLVALTYLAAGREIVWVARIYTSLFWVVGALGLYALARRWVSPWAALVGVGYMLFLPFAVLASRSFQPDPGMVAALLWAAWAWARWLEEPTTRWAWTAGLLSGLAVLVKGYAVFPIAGMAAACVLYRHGGHIVAAFRDWQTWVLALPSVVVLVGYYAFQGLVGFYATTWSFAFLSLLWSPTFYMRWAHNVITWLNGVWLLAAVVGYALTNLPNVLVLASGWAAGYAVYALMVPYLTMTHNYYHLPLLPWIGLGAALLAESLYRMLARQALWRQALVLVAALAAVVYASAVAVRELAAKDYRQEPAFWQELVQKLPPGRYIGLLQDYGLRMTYFGGRNMDIWPDVGLLEVRALKGKETDILTLFRERTQGYDYFLVTAMGQWERQPTLRHILTTYYPVVMQGEGYIVFDLKRPKAQPEAPNP